MFERIIIQVPGVAFLSQPDKQTMRSPLIVIRVRVIGSECSFCPCIHKLCIHKLTSSSPIVVLFFGLTFDCFNRSSSPATSTFDHRIKTKVSSLVSSASQAVTGNKALRRWRRLTSIPLIKPQSSWTSTLVLLSLTTFEDYCGQPTGLSRLHSKCIIPYPPVLVGLTASKTVDNRHGPVISFSSRVWRKESATIGTTIWCHLCQAWGFKRSPTSKNC